MQKYGWLREYIEQVTGETVNPYRVSDEVVYLCPMTGCGDSKGHLYINYDKGVYHCFHCEVKGKLFSFLRKFGIYTNEEEHEKNEPLSVTWADDVTARLNALQNAYDPRPKSMLIPLEGDEVPNTHPLDELGMNYLLYKRDFSLETIRCYKLRSIGYAKYSRIFIPCYMNNELVFWQARAIHPEQKLRYWQPQDSRKSQVLFNYDGVKAYPAIVICEGAFSAMRVGNCAVALFGKSCSNTQLDLLYEMKKEHYYIALDGDALNEAIDLAKRLRRRGMSTSIVTIPYDEDPDTYSIWDADVLETEYDELNYRLSKV